MALNVFGTPSNMTYSGTGSSGDPYVIESTNHSVNTTGEIIFQTTESGTIFPNLTVDSEIASDVAGLFRNTIPIWQASGQDNFSTSFRVSASDQVKVNYIKDGAGAFGDDNVTGSVYFVPDPPEPLPEVAIVMVTQPVSSLSGSVLATQPSVKIVDVNGDIVPGTLISVTVGAVVVSGAAVASGTLTVEPVSGNVVFTDLVITGYGSYYLSFTAAGLTPASSNTITFVQDPGNPNPPIPVKPKRSYIASSVPNSGDMETNEFAINVTDKKGYVRDSNGIIHQVFDGNSGGSGSVTSVGLSSTNSTLTISDSPVTTSGTIKIDLPETGVSAKAYTNADITIDVYGRITTASDGAVGVTSIIAGTGVSVDTATGDVTVTNSAPDQTVTLTDGTGVSVTGTYPDFTITNSLPDQTVSLTNGTAISVTGTYPDFTITNDSPDQTVTLTDGTGISITGTYPDFTITNSAPDQTVSLTEGTDITITGTYPDFTIAYSGVAGGVTSIIAGTGISVDVSTGDVTVTNSAPDQTVSITSGTGINVTGTYPDFTIDSTITQYTNSDARLSLSAGTGISYDNATGIITNSEPDQIVSLTGGTDISVTGTYPDFTIDFDGNTSYLPLSGGTMTGSITSFGTTYDTEVSGDFFGVQLSADHTQGTMVNFDGLDTYDGASHMKVTPTGLTFPDATTQTTAYTGGAGVSSITAGTGINVDTTTGDVTITNEAPDQTVSLTDGTGVSVTGTYPDFTIATTITQYTDSDARLSLSAGTGISYDNATGIITNSAPDQTVSLTAGTSISITGTYPDFTIGYSGTNLSEAENLIAEVYNDSGSTLTKGTIVYINGGHGNLPTVAKALATSDATSAQTFGIVRANITDNNNGYLIIVGNLIDLDTSAYVEGTQLYLSGTTAGTWTSTKPSAPTHLVYVGIVVRSHPTQGVVTVKIQNGYELDEIHDVSITSVADNDILQYNSSTKLWTNVAGTTKNISEDTNLYYTDTRARSSVSSTATGLTYTSGTGVFSLTSGYSIPTTTKQTNWDTAYTQTQQWNGGSTNLVASTGRTSLGATTVGSNLFTLTNPSAVTFPRFNLDNTVSALDAATFRGAIGAGTSSTNGTVTSIATTSPITGGTITGAGTIGINAASANTASFVVQRDASGNFSAGTITASLTGNATGLAASAALTTPTITGLNETKTAPAIASGVLALNCASGNVFHVSLNAAITSITFSNIPTTGTAYGMTLAFTADGTARAITWPAAVKWSGGTAPTLTSTNAKVDIFVLTTWDGGTTWYAMTGGQNF